MPSAIEVKGLTKVFETGSDTSGTVAVDAVDLEVDENEFVVMLGPSGCGKSTILRLIAGLEDATAGEVYIAGERIDNLPTRARNIGFMFQGYALFQHMSVADNIGYGLRIDKVPKEEARRRVDELMSLMGIDGLADRRPRQISGGQQQRVALARALAPRPRVLLLDEPFGAVDAKVRQKLRRDTKDLQRELKIPTILVTHDQREALELGDRVAVMNEGRFEQLDYPEAVYERPATEFVGNFVGRANVFETGLLEGGPVKDARFQVMVRPEDVSVSPVGPDEVAADGTVAGTVATYAFLGRTVRIEVLLDRGSRLTVALTKQEAAAKEIRAGSRVAVSLGSCNVFPIRQPPADGIAAGRSSHIAKAEADPRNPLHVLARKPA